VDGAEDGLPVIGNGFFAGGRLAFHIEMDERPTREREADTGAKTPNFAVGSEEGVHVIAQIAPGAGEPDGREVCGFGDADVGITRGDLALGGGDIGAALQHAGGDAGGDGGRGFGSDGALIDVEVAGGLAA
jgi:hypothetical protein